MIYFINVYEAYYIYSYIQTPPLLIMILYNTFNCMFLKYYHNY